MNPSFKPPIPAIRPDWRMSDAKSNRCSNPAIDASSAPALKAITPKAAFLKKPSCSSCLFSCFKVETASSLDIPDCINRWVSLSSLVASSWFFRNWSIIPLDEPLHPSLTLWERLFSIPWVLAVPWVSLLEAFSVALTVFFVAVTALAACDCDTLSPFFIAVRSCVIAEFWAAIFWSVCSIFVAVASVPHCWILPLMPEINTSCSSAMKYL